MAIVVAPFDTITPPRYLDEAFRNAIGRITTHFKEKFTKRLP